MEIYYSEKQSLITHKSRIHKFSIIYKTSYMNKKMSIEFFNIKVRVKLIHHVKDAAEIENH